MNKIFFHHEKIKFISSNYRVIFFLLYRFNENDVIDIFTSEDMENMSLDIF